MKTIIITGIALLALGGTWGMAQESKKEGHSGMQDMMKDMMKESKSDENSRGMMQGMGGMMSMMNMMEQCNEMMKSGHHHGEKAKETKQK
jgi:hypothetical protein